MTQKLVFVFFSRKKEDKNRKFEEKVRLKYTRKRIDHRFSFLYLVDTVYTLLMYLFHPNKKFMNSKIMETKVSNLFLMRPELVQTSLVCYVP